MVTLLRSVLLFQGCMSQGKTREKAVQNIREAIALCLETRRALGLMAVEVEEVEAPV